MGQELVDRVRHLGKGGRRRTGVETQVAPQFAGGYGYLAVVAYEGGEAGHPSTLPKPTGLGAAPRRSWPSTAELAPS